MSSTRDCAVAGRPASILSTLCVGRRLFSLLLNKPQPARQPPGEKEARRVTQAGKMRELRIYGCSFNLSVFLSRFKFVFSLGAQ